MFSDTLYKGLFQSQMLWGIPVTACFFSVLCVSFVVVATTDPRFFVLFLFPWTFFFLLNRQDPDYVDVVLQRIHRFGFSRRDKKIKAVIHG